jgi:hypothetical protein
VLGTVDLTGATSGGKAWREPDGDAAEEGEVTMTWPTAGNGDSGVVFEALKRCDDVNGINLLQFDIAVGYSPLEFPAGAEGEADDDGRIPAAGVINTQHPENGLSSEEFDRGKARSRRQYPSHRAGGCDHRDGTAS